MLIRSDSPAGELDAHLCIAELARRIAREEWASQVQGITNTTIPLVKFVISQVTNRILVHFYSFLSTRMTVLIYSVICVTFLTQLWMLVTGLDPWRRWVGT